jgi:transketolase
VLDALATTSLRLRYIKLAVRHMPGSGRPVALLRAAGIDAEAIVKAVRSLMGPKEIS